MQVNCTVKLGYNDHGYNEHTVITDKITYLVWFSMFYQKNFMDIMNNFSNFHGYNEQVGNFLGKLMKITYFKTKKVINFMLLKI